MDIFKRKKEEFDISNMIPEHHKEWDSAPEKKERSAEIPPVSDFFSSVPDTPTPAPVEPLFPEKKTEYTQHRSEISRVDIELILSKLENIDHRLRWMEEQLRRKGTI